ncbi:MAG: T9SS type A sorting domain-containing protein [Candidatus Delongbacteria bacterium]|nr:T9SS type A sorting domain-containing protein [Candidatus Delongbacteria bacterium]MBN2833742.1 T9SS type A sorting domain-containing protein [Candidatus Delongbacteria bacterium]
MWEEAGSAPNNNIIGIDPILNDPMNGDYSLSENSPAIGYGCLSFTYKKSSPINSVKINGLRLTSSQNERVGGKISIDTIWDQDTIKVMDNILIENGTTLSINPGTTVEFYGDYKIDVKGQFLAQGNSDNNIYFTVNDTTGFGMINQRLGCWGGIQFHNTSSANDSSKIEYCNFQFSKHFTDLARLEDGCGGAISVYNFSKLMISNSIFKNNVSNFGGAIGVVFDSNPLIYKNLMIENYALKNGSAITAMYSYPKIIGNTIYNNINYNFDPTVEERSAVFSFISKATIKENIIYNNFSNPGQMRHNKLYYTTYNSVEGYLQENGNIISDPLFIDPENHNFNLDQQSPCIDAGDPLSPFDLDNTIADIGCYYYDQIVDVDEAIVIDECRIIQNYPNPFNGSTIISYKLYRENSVKLEIYNTNGELVFIYDLQRKFAGIHSFNFDAENLNSGVYFYSIILDNGDRYTNKMIYIK